MPSAIATPSASGLVPTIDIASYLANTSSAAADDIVKAVRSACLTTGFFQVVGHGVSRELQQASFDAAATFFALSLEEKKKLDISKSIGHRGYDLMGTQSYGADTLPDLKEVLFTFVLTTPLISLARMTEVYNRAISWALTWNHPILA